MKLVEEVKSELGGWILIYWKREGGELQ